jgi:hydrogenase maturation protease
VKGTRIICIGNRHLPEDAIGPRVYDRLQERGLPEDTDLVDGGLMGLDLLPFFEGAGRIVFVDRICGFAAEGEVVVLSGSEVAEAAGARHDHGAGLPYLLRCLPRVLEGNPPEILLVGVESPPDEEVLEEACRKVLDLVGGGGGPCMARFKGPQPRSIEEILEENALLRQEVEVSRRAAEITASLVVEQFGKMEEIHRSLEEANRSLQRLSAVDGLTGIPNRRYFDEMLDREWRRCRRNGLPLSVVLADVDFFKAYNDHYGHVAGDRCLQSVARALQKHLNRAADFVARYGGEEFAFVLPETDLAGALAVAETVRAGVEALEIPHRGSRVGNVVSVSMGVGSVVPDGVSEPSFLIRVADLALYQAKAEGRNRIMTRPFSTQERLFNKICG